MDGYLLDATPTSELSIPLTPSIESQQRRVDNGSFVYTAHIKSAGTLVPTRR